MNQYDITGGGANGGRPGDTSLMGRPYPWSSLSLAFCFMAGGTSILLPCLFATFLPHWEPKSSGASQSQTETRKQSRSSLRRLTTATSWLTKYRYTITHFSPITMQGPPLPKKRIPSLLLKPCAGGLMCSLANEPPS